MAVDGYVILDLTHEDLETDLGVKINLHRKKIINGNNFRNN